MANVPFSLLRGNLKIGADAATAISAADAVHAFTLSASRETAEVPAVLATGDGSTRAGATTYEITIEYLGDDTTTTTLWNQLWDAVNTNAGTLYFAGTFHDGVVSATNPQYAGNFIVTGAAIGGTVGEIVTDEQTFPLLARPVRTVAP